MSTSLRQRLKQEVREWHQVNVVRRQYAVGWARRSVLALSSRLRIVGSALCIVAGVVCGVTTLPEKYWVLWRFPEFVIPDSVDYFGLLWTTQATIVALVYPLVISLVAILLQRRPGSATLNVYLHDSGALLAGLGGVVLVAVMGVQYLFVPYLSDSRLAAWVVLDGMWFLLNVVLMLHFLVRTFDFIRPDRRFAIISQYVAGVAWPAEAQRLLARNMFENPVGWKLMAAPDPSDTVTKLQVSFGQSVPFDGVPVETRTFTDRASRVVDVHFGKLTKMLRMWEGELDRHNEASMEAPAPTVHFPITPYEDRKGDVVLCLSEHAGTPSKRIRRGIRKSFVINRSSPPPPVSTEDVFEDLLADTLLSLRVGDEQAFKLDLARLTDLYELLIQVSRVKNTEGETESLTGLLTGEFFGGMRPYERWSRFYYELVAAAARRLSHGDELLSSLMPVPVRLFVRCQEAMSPPMLRRFIDMPEAIWNVLADWRGAHESYFRKHQEIDQRNSLASNQPTVEIRAIHDFVDGWEPFAGYLIRQKSSTPTAIRASANWLHRHVCNTAMMILQSCHRNDREGAEWMTDVLIKWFNNISHKLPDTPSYYYRRDLSFVTVDTFTNDAPAPTTHMGERDDLETRFGLAIKHAWIDAVVLALSAFASWVQIDQQNAALLARLFGDLLHGRPLRAGGGHSHGRAIESLGQALTALFRQRDSGDVYRERQGEVAGEVRGIRRSRMVSGRVYSSVGDDLGTLAGGTLLLMMTLTDATLRAERAALPILEGLTASNPAAATSVLQRISTWRAQLNLQAFDAHKPAYELLRQHSAGAFEFEDARKRLDQDLAAAHASIERARTQAVAQQPISEVALNRIATWCSAAISPETDTFPLSLFDTRMIGAAGGGAEEVVRLKYARSVLVEPTLEDDAINAEEFFGELTRKAVAARVMGAVMNAVPPKRVRAHSPTSYWSQFKKAVANFRTAGLHPVLVLDDVRQPPWLLDLAYPVGEETTRPPKGIELRNDHPLAADGYRWHLNEVPTYDGPIPSGASLLLPEEAFAEVVFHPGTNGSLIQVTAHDSPDHPETVDLQLSWRVSVATRSCPGVSLVYRKAQSS